MSTRQSRGFTLVEVLVALMIVAIGLAALMVAVSGTARTSGYLRDKTLAQWIALNRLTEVRLNRNNKFAKNTDAAELNFAGRTWHYDTRYFDTSFTTMKRIVVRVYAGGAKTKGNPLAESTSFLGAALGPADSANIDWKQGSTPQSLGEGDGGKAGTPVNVTPGSSTPPGARAPSLPNNGPIIASPNSP